MREVEISKEPIELYKILKFESMVSSGGEAKMVIAEGRVLVNGKVETQKRKKIVSGDTIEFGQEKIRLQLRWVNIFGGEIYTHQNNLLQVKSDNIQFLT